MIGFSWEVVAFVAAAVAFGASLAALGFTVYVLLLDARS